jgi:polysaccharide export outer membrane protein
MILKRLSSTILLRSCILLGLVVFFISSCTPQRKLVYLQGDPAVLQDSSVFIMTVQPGDILLVQLNSVNAEAFPAIGLLASNIEGNDTRSAYEKGIVVDNEGNLSLPYIGSVYVQGSTVSQVRDAIVQRFKRYLDEPVVVVKKLSFKITILGEVNRPGLYYVPNEQLTILEALALAGDLNNFADRTCLRIIRRSGAGSVEIPFDLTNKNAYTGATKFIHPDDVIYAQPTRKKAFTAITPATAVVTSLITAIALIATAYFRAQ